MGTRSAVVKPTSASDGSQTGIQPPLTTTAKAFEATPTMTTSIPGTARLCHSATSSKPKAPPKSGSRSVSAMATPLAMASSVPKRSMTARNRRPDHRILSVEQVAGTPRTSSPSRNPMTTPPISTLSG